jgi:hypothetical protein
MPLEGCIPQVSPHSITPFELSIYEVHIHNVQKSSGEHDTDQGFVMPDSRPPGVLRVRFDRIPHKAQTELLSSSPSLMDSFTHPVLLFYEISRTGKNGNVFITLYRTTTSFLAKVAWRVRTVLNYRIVRQTLQVHGVLFG